MQYGEFVEQYKPSFTAGSNLPPELAEVERQCVETGRALHEYLSGGPATLEDVSMLAFAASRTAHDNVDALAEPINAEAAQDREPTSYDNTSVGHITTALMLPVVIAGTARLRKGFGPDILLNVATHGLGRYGLEVFKERTHLSEESFVTRRPGLPYKLFSEHYQAYNGLSIGLGTEIDVSLLLVEMQRKHPELVVFPSPPQFERGAYNHIRQADMLIINKLARQIVGVQVKARAQDSDIHPETADTVVLVSGDEDLSNTKCVRRFPLRSDLTRVSWPGYIALHRLATFDVQRVANAGVKLSAADVNSIRSARMMAQQVNRDVRPKFRDAYDNVSRRLFSRLDVSPERAFTPPPKAKGTKRKRAS